MNQFANLALKPKGFLGAKSFLPSGVGHHFGLHVSPPLAKSLWQKGVREIFESIFESHGRNDDHSLPSFPDVCVLLEVFCIKGHQSTQVNQVIQFANLALKPKGFRHLGM
jgi:hypothetical protein